MGMMVGSMDAAAAAQAMQSEKDRASEKSRSYGKTVGSPQLSEKGAKYYEQLKAKFSGYDFILVSEDEKEHAQARAAAYANKDKTVVLINEDKIERMATDANYRKQYENVLSGAKAQIGRLAERIGSRQDVKGFGIKIGDNGAASFFAVCSKNASANAKAQKKRLEKKAAEKKEAKRKESKKAAEERLDAMREKRRGEAAGYEDDYDEYLDEDEDYEILTGSSIDELMDKVERFQYSYLSDNILTDEERAVGGNIDFRG